MIKVIATDFGGVYFTWNFENYLKELAEAIQVDVVKVKEGIGNKIKEYHVAEISEKEYWDSFCEVIGKQIDHKFLKTITENQFKPIEENVNLFKDLRKKYKLVMIANQTPLLDRLNEKYGFYKNFDELINSHVVKLMKPDKAIFLLLLEKMNCQPEEVVFIDDAKKNILAAQEMGFKTILFSEGDNLAIALKKMLH